MIAIELFGVPRLRAGVGRLEVEAADLGGALSALRRACPKLEGIYAGGSIHPAYKVSLNGERFVSDPGTALEDGDALLLLSADVGG